MARYTQVNYQQIQALADRYGMELDDYEPMQGGNENSSYLLYVGEFKLVLTIFEIDISRVQALVKTLRLLAGHGFPTTRVLDMSDGGSVTRLMGKPALLKSYIPGDTIKRMEENMLLQVGSALAKLHKIPAPDFLPTQHSYGLQSFGELINQDVDISYEFWLSNKLMKFEETIPAGLPQKLIHGDVFWDNVLFENGNFKAIIDFEEACVYYRLFDLGMAIVGLCAQGDEIKIEKTRTLLSGYQDQTRLKRQERKYLQLFIEYAATATSAWRFRKYHLETPRPEYADSHWEMAAIADSVVEISKSDFYTAVFD